MRDASVLLVLGQLHECWVLVGLLVMKCLLHVLIFPTRLAEGEQQMYAMRMSSRRTHTASLLERVTQDLGLPYPLRSARNSSKDTLVSVHLPASPTPTKDLALPTLSGLAPGGNIKAVEKRSKGGKRQKALALADGAHKQGLLFSAIQNAAESYNPQISQCAAPAAAAIAVSGNSPAGTIETIVDLFLKTQHTQVKADCMDALASTVSKDQEACENFLHRGGMMLVVKCHNSS